MIWDRLADSAVLKLQRERNRSGVLGLVVLGIPNEHVTTYDQEARYLQAVVELVGNRVRSTADVCELGRLGICGTYVITCPTELRKVVAKVTGTQEVKAFSNGHYVGGLATRKRQLTTFPPESLRQVALIRLDKTEQSTSGIDIFVHGEKLASQIDRVITEIGPTAETVRLVECRPRLQSSHFEAKS